MYYQSGPYLEGPGTLLTSGSVSFATQPNSFYADLFVDDGATWSNSGSVSDAGAISFGGQSDDTASFINQAGGVFDLTADNAGITANGNYTGVTATFANAGLLDKTGGEGTSTIAASITNSPTGTIEVDSGVLELTDGGDLDGTIDGAGGVILLGGTTTLESGTSISVAELTLSGGVVVLNGDVTISGGVTDDGAVIELNGHTLTLSGTTIFDGDDTIYGPGLLQSNDTGTVYNAASAFEQGWTASNNPNGVWQYGYSSGFSGPVTLYNQTEQNGINGPNAQYWVSSSEDIGTSPAAEYNDGPAYNDGNVNFAANQFLLVAGVGGQYSDLVFTAPSSGLYSIASSFLGDQSGIGTVVAIVANGTIIFQSSITTLGEIVPSSADVNLAAGQTVEFSVGPGGGYQNTGLDATISYVGAGPIILSPITTPAIAQLNTPTLVNFGTVHAGISASETISVTNAATPPSQGLDVSISTSGAALGSGSINLLPAGQTDTIDLTLGLDTDAAGVQSGSALLGFASGGLAEGADATVLQSSTIAVSGTIYRLAAPQVTAPSNAVLHVGDGGGTGTIGLSVGNTDPADGYSENLLAAATGAVTGGLLGASGSTGEIAPGAATSNGGLGFTPSGSVTPDNEANSPVNLGMVFTANVNFSISALGFYVLPDLTGSETVGLFDSAGNLLASAVVSLADPQSNGYAFQSITPVALTAGDQYVVDAFIGNNDYGYASAAPIQNPDITFNYGDYLYTNSLAFPVSQFGIAYYGPNFEIASPSLTVTIPTTSAGTVFGTAAVTLTSDGTGIDNLGTTPLGTTDVPVGVTIDNYATASIEQTGGTGTLAPADVANVYTLDLGSAEQGTGSLSTSLEVLNAAQGPAADLLDGSFTISGNAEFANSGFGDFAGLNFGDADTDLGITLNTGTFGLYTETIVVTPTGTNESGFIGTLPAETIDVVGTITPAAFPSGTLTIAAGQTLALYGASFGEDGSNGPSIEGPGTLLTTGPIGLLAQSGVDYPDMILGDGVTWINTGTVDVAALISLGLLPGDTATILNEPTGVFDLTSDQAGIAVADSTDTASFDNAGLLEKTAGSGTSDIAAPFNDTGTVLVNTGTIEFDGGGNLAGLMGGAGTVLLQGGTTTLGAGATITVANFAMSAGALMLGADQTIVGTLTDPGEVIDLNGYTLTLAGDAAFNNGATIEGPGTVISTGSISFGGTAATTIDPGVAWFNTGAMDVEGEAIFASLTLSGGTVDGVGTLTVSGSLELDNSPVMNGIGLTVAQGTVSLGAGFPYGLDLVGGHTFENSGTFTVSNDYDLGAVTFGYYDLGGTNSFVNDAGAVLDDQVDGTLTYDSSGTNSISNAGLLQKSGGDGTSVIDVEATNTGTINVASGVLELDSGGVIDGTLEGVGTLALAGGTFTSSDFNALSASNLLLDGGVVGFSATSIDGTFTETAGAASFTATSDVTGTTSLAAGTVAIAAGQTLTVSGSASIGTANGAGPFLEGPGTLLTSGSVSLVAQNADYGDLFVGDGVTWSNSGTVSDAGLVQFGLQASDTATFVNQIGGVFDLTTDNAGLTQYDYFYYATATFDNDGLLEKTGGTGTSYIEALLTNTGTINVASGVLELDSGGVIDGTLEGVGTLALAGGTFTSSDLTGLSGSNLLVDGGVVDFSAASIDGTFTEIFGAASFTATSDITGTTSLTGGTVAIAADQTLSVSGSASIGTATYLEGPGTLLTSGPVSLVGEMLFGDGATWSNSGTASDAGLVLFGVQVSDTVTFVNQTGGVFDLTTDTAGFTEYDYGNYATATFDNAGLLEKTGGTGTNYIEALLTNTGTINVASGVLELDSGGVIDGTLEGVGTLALAGGTFTSSDFAGLSGSNLLLDGGVVGFSAASIDGTFTETTGAASFADAADLTGTILLTGGTVAIAADQTLTVSGSASIGSAYGGAAYLEGPGTLVTSGPVSLVGEMFIGDGVTWSNSGTVSDAALILSGLQDGDTATFVNQSGGVFDLTTDTAGFTDYIYPLFVNATFDNAGLLAKIGGAGTSTIAATVNSTGRIEVDSGVLELTAGGSFAGTIAGNGTVAFAGGRSTLSALASGNLLVDGGILDGISGSEITGSIAITDGKLSVGASQTLTVSGSASIGTADGGANLEGPGTLVTSGPVSLVGEVFVGDGITWSNSGTVSDAGPVVFVLQNSYIATFVNQTGGVFDLTTDAAGFTVNYYVDYATPTFDNAGLLAKTGGTGTSYIEALLTNTGTINVASGVLELDSGGVIDGTLEGAGTLALAGGTFTSSDFTGLSDSNLLLDGGVVGFSVVSIDGALTETDGAAGFAATADVAGTILLTGGTIAIAADQTLTISGSASLGVANEVAPYLEGPGTLVTSGLVSLVGEVFFGDGVTWSNSGTVSDAAPILFGIQESDTATLINQSGGVVDLTTDGGSIYNESGGQQTFDNAGLLAKTGGTGTSYIEAPLTNTGTINVASGVLELDSGGVIDGTLEGAGILALAGGTFTSSDFAVLSGSNLLLDGGVVGFSTASIDGTFTETTGAASFAATADITGAISLTGGTVAIAADQTLTVSGSASLGVVNEVAPYLEGPGTLFTSGPVSLVRELFIGDGVTWSNSGTVSDAGLVVFGLQDSDTATFVNQTGGVFDLTTDNAGFTEGYYRYYATVTFHNAGLLAKTGGTGTCYIEALLTNTGTINVASGVLELDSGGTLGGTIVGAGVLEITGSTPINLAAQTGPIATTVLLQGGTLVLQQNVAVSGTFIDDGGVIDLNGFSLTLAGDATLDGGIIEGPGELLTTGSVVLPSGTALTVGGDAVWANSGTVDDAASITLGDTGDPGGTIDNQAAGVFDLSADTAQIAVASGAAGLFDNEGLFAKTGGGATSTIAAALVNTGLVDAESGTTALVGGGSSDGDGLQVEAGAALSFGGGDFVISGGTMTGAGTVTLVAGTLDFGAIDSAIAAAFAQSGGDLTGSGTVEIFLPVWLTGGLEDGTGDTVLDAGGTIEGTIEIDGGRTLTNIGTVTFLGGSTVEMGSGSAGTLHGATIDNALAALWDTIGDPTLIADGSGNNVFNNYGVFLKELTGGSQTVQVNFNNYGTIINHDGQIGFVEIENYGTSTVTGTIDYPSTPEPPPPPINNPIDPGQVRNTTSYMVTMGTVTFAPQPEEPPVYFDNPGTVDIESLTPTTYADITISDIIIQYMPGTTILTAGTWIIGNNGTLIFKTPPNPPGEPAIQDILTNNADVTLKTTSSSFDLIDELATNNGAFRILDGRDYTTYGDFTNNGLLQLGGGIFASGTNTFSETSGGTIAGYGTFTGAMLDVAGTIDAVGGVLDFSTATTEGATPELLVDAAALGGLSLGTNDLAVSGTYFNTDWGTGNSFAPRTGVTGSGGIIGLGAGMALVGVDGTTISTDSAGETILDLGTYTPGSVVTLSFAIENTGAAGAAAISGAIQTEVDGGVITSAALSGSGVTAQNFGPIAAGAEGQVYTISVDTSAGVPQGQAIHIASDFDNVAGITLAIGSPAAGLASPSEAQPNPVAFGNVHVGDAPQRALTIANTAAFGAASLDAAIGDTTGAVTAAGTIDQLAPGTIDTTDLLVSLDTETAGAEAGTATITLASVAGGSSTPLAPQIISATGTVWRLATAMLPGTLDLGTTRTGDVDSTGLAITNSAADDGYSEDLSYALAAPTAGFFLPGSSGGVVAAQQTATPAVGIDAENSGIISGSVGVTLASTGAGTSFLADTPLPSATVDLTGTVYATATAQLGTTTVDFGILHVGQSGTVTDTVTNMATGSLTDILEGGLAVSLIGPISGIGSLGAGLPAGESAVFTFTFAEETLVGVYSGSLPFAFTSHDTAQPDAAALGATTIDFVGTVENYATAAIEEFSGPGTFSQIGSSYTLDLGTVLQGGTTVSAHLAVLNEAVGPADFLSGNFVPSGSGAFTNAGLSFADLGAGQSYTGATVSLATNAAGIFTEVLTLASTGSDASGYSGALATETLTITGTIASAPGQSTGSSGVVGGGGQSGGAGGSANAAAANSSSNNSAVAQGGAGGAGGPNTQSYSVAGAGGAGGAAVANATTNLADPAATADATATSDGGDGGASGAPGAGHGNIGGTGGSATASTTAINMDGAAVANAISTGGTGGDASGASQNAGVGGVASGTAAYAHGTTSATATVTQSGGNGGAGLDGAKGSSGAASNLVDAVSGETDGGTLTLEQDAIGGNGGTSGLSVAGSGGAASSSLTFDDTTNATESANIFGTAKAIGGNAAAGTLFSPTGGPASATVHLTGAGNVTATGVATGGMGGNGSQSIGGAAGATVTSVAGETAIATATATGGASATNSMGGGVVGAAANAAIAKATGQIAIATATGTGGAGGAAIESLQGAGKGGVVSSTSANATGISAATASATQIGGQGGAASEGGGGGAGGLSTLSNAVSGSTDGGTLVLNEVAQGGVGGTSDSGPGGAGGFATAGLNFDDTKNATQSASILATITGIGGDGGDSGGIGGSGGGVLDSGTVTGAGSVTLDVTAEGGNAGTGLGGVGGAASATSTATGEAVNSTATADGGVGKMVGGQANASAVANGNSGTVLARSQTGLAPGSLIIGATGYATAPVGGYAAASSAASIGTATVYVVNRSAVSNVTAAPLAAPVARTLAAQPIIATTLGGDAINFAIGELGGGHSSSGTAVQTSTATADVTLDTLLLAAQQDLILSLFQPIWTGSNGITDVKFSLSANGSTLVMEDFSTAAAAGNWFADHAINLGPLEGASSVDLHLALSVTTRAAGSSFDGAFLLAGKPV